MGPLSDIKVLELGTLIAGPFCSRIFAEFGAQVIKIESPDGGDPLRQWRKLHNGTSLWWYLQARNKKSVTVNMREPEGQEIVRKLAAGADIVIENFRPGTLEKWGLGWDRLSQSNPGLVMVRLSGYGQTGPYRSRAGFGAIGEAMAGLRYVTGYPDRAPVRVGISLGDAVASLYGVIGALMALRHREVSGGRGQMVDVALYEAVFSLMESLLPGVRHDRFCPRTQRRFASGHRAFKYLYHPRRQVRRHRRQRRCDLQAHDDGDRARGSRQRSGARAQ